MTFRGMAWYVAAGMIIAIGCGGGGSESTGGGGATTTSSAGGSGGDTTTTTTTTTTSTTTSTSGTGGSTPLEPSGFSCTGATPSLANDVVPITTMSCAKGSGCHVAAKSAPGMVDQFVNRIAEQCLDSRLMIEPGAPEKSYLIHKLTNHNICTGQTMPKDEPMLAAGDIQIIYDWICNGAPNN